MPQVTFHKIRIKSKVRASKAKDLLDESCDLAISARCRKWDVGKGGQYGASQCVTLTCCWPRHRWNYFGFWMEYRVISGD